MNPVRSAHVRVPCSTSNLGPGFDTVGLALTRYLSVRFTPGHPEDGLELVRGGTLAGLDGPPDEDLLLQAFRARIGAAGAGEPAGTLAVTSEIPVARGLGSSAAALVAGWSVAGAALGQDSDPHGAFLNAFGVEGHGDNAAPCTFGGLRAVVRTTEGPRVVALELSEDVGFAYAAPAAGISTQAAREALPRTVEHATAVHGLGRLAALIQGLAAADADLIRVGVRDELHVPHRLPLIPGAYNAIGAGYDAGAWGVTISGAGSGLIAMCAPGDAPAVAAAMHDVFRVGADDPECVGFALEPDRVGVVQLPK